MESFFYNLVPVAIIAVFVVLVLGLVNLIRGGNSNRSQMLMRWRVILQFIAIVIIVVTIYLARG